jgi:hypothetical protein
VFGSIEQYRVVVESRTESSCETPACRDLSLGAEEFNWVGIGRIMVRKELGGAKKTSCAISIASETVINPLPGYD